MGTMSQLVRVEQDQAYVRLVSDHLTAELSPRDLRLVTMLVAGVTRWRRYLDFLVSHYYHGDMDKLEPAVLQVRASASSPPGRALWLSASEALAGRKLPRRHIWFVPPIHQCILWALCSLRTELIFARRSSGRNERGESGDHIHVDKRLPLALSSVAETSSQGWALHVALLSSESYASRQPANIQIPASGPSQESPLLTWRLGVDGTLNASSRHILPTTPTESRHSACRLRAVARWAACMTQVLRMGVYELVKMRTPPHAVSSEYVSLTKRTVRIQAASLVNAVLRAVDVQQLPDPMPAALDEHGATSPGATTSHLNRHLKPHPSA
jgi:transcription termination factor NusB